MPIDEPNSWLYKRRLMISDPANVSANYPIRLTVYHSSQAMDSPANGTINLGGRCVQWPDDIRFGDGPNPNTCNRLPQFIESYDSEKAEIWIKLPDDGSDTIYLFVGNWDVYAYSRGNEVFDLFDHFSGNALNTSKWTRGNYASIWFENNTILCISSDIGHEGEGIVKSKDFFSAPARVRARAKMSNFVGAYLGFYYIDSGSAIWACDDYDPNFFMYFENFDPDENVINTNSVDSNVSVEYIWHTWEIRWTGNPSIRSRGFIDDDHETINDWPDADPIWPLQVIMQGNAVDTSYATKIDWIFVSKYSLNEPTWSSYGPWMETKDKKLDANTVLFSEIRKAFKMDAAIYEKYNRNYVFDSFLSHRNSIQTKIFTELTTGKQTVYSFSTRLSTVPYTPPSDVYIELPDGSLIPCVCSRWDQEDFKIIFETYLDKSRRDILRSNIRPGAVDELYQMLGRKVYYDTSFGQNTIRLVPLAGTLLSLVRSEKIIYVKNYSERITPANDFHIKIEGYISGSFI